MISIAQIRAARALLDISLEDLSKASGIAIQTIRNLEESGGGQADSAGLLALREALEDLGVVFFAAGDCPDGGEGLRLKARGDADEGIRPENLNATNDD